MKSLITSYLWQNKECVLPGIGSLHIIKIPALTDSDNNRILPRSEAVIFKKEDSPKDPSLIKYIADKKDMEQGEAENMLNNFCNDWKEKINTGDVLNFETIGSIQTDPGGKISLRPENNFNFLQPIHVSDAYKRAEQIISIAEVPDVTAVNVVEQNVVVERSSWGLWVLILFAIGAVIIFYHFKDHKLSGLNIGNQNQLPIDSPTDTYRLPNK